MRRFRNLRPKYLLLRADIMAQIQELCVIMLDPVELSLLLHLCYGALHCQTLLIEQKQPNVLNVNVKHLDDKYTLYITNTSNIYTQIVITCNCGTKSAVFSMSLSILTLKLVAFISHICLKTTAVKRPPLHTLKGHCSL